MSIRAEHFDDAGRMSHKLLYRPQEKCHRVNYFTFFSLWAASKVKKKIIVMIFHYCKYLPHKVLQKIFTIGLFLSTFNFHFKKISKKWNGDLYRMKWTLILIYIKQTSFNIAAHCTVPVPQAIWFFCRSRLARAFFE